MRCTKCGSENPDSKQFCSDCGTPFGSRCPKCSAENPVGKKFCGDCGTALANKASIHIATTHTAETPAPEIRMRPEQLDASATADGERKTITALFADIKGSTELMRDLDPEEARAIVDPVLQLMMAAVHRYDGYVAQSTGDGIFALFGAPVAHEDHPQRALHAALAMQQAIRELRSDTRGGGSSHNRDARWGEHGRGGGADHRDRRPYRIHAGRSCDQSGGANADGGPVGLDRGQ